MLRVNIDNDMSKVPILLYHYINDDNLRNETDSSVKISVSDFEEQMKYLYSNGYYTATLEEVERFFNKEQSFDNRTVVITFDDGYLNNTELAYPIMKRYGMKGSIFIIGSYSINGKIDNIEHHYIKCSSFE